MVIIQGLRQIVLKKLILVALVRKCLNLHLIYTMAIHHQTRLEYLVDLMIITSKSA